MRAAWLGAALALAMLAPGPGPSPSSSAVPPSPLVRVTTFNTLHTRAPGPVHRDLVRLAARSDVMLLQETTRAAWVVSVPGFRVARFPGRPILYRAARFTLAAAGSRFAQAQPIRRRITWVRLIDRATGQALTVVDYHGLPHVERAGHPRHLPRVAAYARAMGRLGALVRALPGPLVVGGDWNVNRWADRRVRWHGFPAAWEARHPRLRDADRFRSPGTLGARTVDYLFSRELSAVALRVGRHFGSDHRPVTVTYAPR